MPQAKLKEEPLPVDELDAEIAKDKAAEQEESWWQGEPEPEWGIHRRLLWVQANTPTLAKDLDVSTGRGSYKGISHDSVVGIIRPLLVRAGIAVTMTVEKHYHEFRSVETAQGTKSAHWHEVDCVFTFTNVDKPDDFVQVCGSGTGLDTQDKGYGKATSYAKKYALLTSTLAETGEDPERGEQHDDAGPADPKPRAAAQPQAETTEPAVQSQPHPLAAEIPEDVWREVAGLWHTRGTISDKQLGRLFAIARSEGGWQDSDSVGAVIKHHLGIESTHLIPWGKPYDALVEIFRQYGPVVAQEFPDDDLTEDPDTFINDVSGY
jgi:hypothetical protein